MIIAAIALAAAVVSGPIIVLPDQVYTSGDHRSNSISTRTTIIEVEFDLGELTDPTLCIRYGVENMSTTRVCGQAIRLGLSGQTITVGKLKITRKRSPFSNAEAVLSVPPPRSFRTNASLKEE